MDLGAYTNIYLLDSILEENQIEIPRLRGLRLMSLEKQIPKEELEDMSSSQALDSISSMLGREFWDHNGYLINMGKQEFYSDYYLIKGGKYSYKDVRWSRVHGRLRKAMKFEIKKAKKAVYDQYTLFNKYAGQEDILYIHARLGRNSWTADRDKLINQMRQQPWFLEMVTDSYDSTYIDIYAKIKPVDMEALEKKQEELEKEDEVEETSCE